MDDNHTKCECDDERATFTNGECYCNAGYEVQNIEEDTGQCVPCKAGMWKKGTGPNVCLYCDSSQSSHLSTIKYDTETCNPLIEYASISQENCTCSPGFYDASVYSPSDASSGTTQDCRPCTRETFPRMGLGNRSQHTQKETMLAFWYVSICRVGESTYTA